MYFKLPADGMSQKPKRVAKNKLDIHVVVIDRLYFLIEACNFVNYMQNPVRHPCVKTNPLKTKRICFM
jgi:hypothetical protein